MILKDALDRYSSLALILLNEADSFADHLRYASLLPVEGLPVEQSPYFLHRLIGGPGISDYSVDRGGGLLKVRRCRSQPAFTRLGVPEHRHQGLVELMCNRSRQFRNHGDS